MLKNRRSSEELIPHAPAVVMIYGPPNSGKTTIAATAGRTLFLDFERSLGRSDLVGHVEDRVDVEKWEDVKDLAADDLDGIDTVVVDTVGEMVQKIATYVQALGGAMSNRDGSISLKGYGKVADIFQAWTNVVRNAGCNLLLTAHAKEEMTATDEKQIRPDVMGSSLKMVTRACAAIGYATMNGGKGQVSWSPAQWWAKGPMEWGNTMPVPRLQSNLTWMKDRIDELGEIEQKRQKSAVEAAKASAPALTLAEAVPGATDPLRAANEALAAALSLPDHLAPPVKAVLHRCATASGLTYDRAEGRYIKAEEAEEEA